MNHTQLFSALKAGDIKRCYLFEGVEELTKRSALEMLRQAVLPGDFADMNGSEMTDPDAGAIIAACETLPFLAQRRLLVVRECAMLTGVKPKEYDEDASVSRLKEYLPQMPDSSCLVFYVRGKADKRKKLYTVLSKCAEMVSFEPLDDRELASWIASRLKKAGKRVSSAACQRLWFTSGRDLTLLSNELDKLAASVGEREEITQEDIAALCAQTTEYKVFDLADALLSGQGKRAFDMLKGILMEGEDRLFLLTLLGRQCRQLRYAKLLSGQGGGRDLASALGIPLFAAKRCQEQARNYTIEQLGDMASWCLETEYNVKSGQIADVGSLENVMLRILDLRGGMV